jgi:uncharacterized protein (TIGR00369 family)
MSSTQHLLPRQRDVLDIPLNRHLGIVFDGSVDGIAKSHFQSTPELATFDGQLHGGALSVLFEVAAFLALAPLLKETQHAVTHDLHVSLMRPVPTGARCDLEAHVVRSGRTLAFLEVRAYVEGKQVASARITKSIIALTNT